MPGISGQGGYHLSEMRSSKLPGSASGASSRSEDSEYLPYVQWLGATMGWSSLHLIISTLKPMNQGLETIATAMTSLEHSNILMWSVCVYGDVSISWSQLSPRLCQIRWLRHCEGIGVHQGPALVTSAKLMHHLHDNQHIRYTLAL